MSRIRRVHHPGVFRPGETVCLAPGESRHLCRVLRLGAGDRVRVFDGSGGEWDAVILTADSREARLRIGGEIRSEVDAVFPVELFQGLCRPERVDWLLQKGTEVGVAAFHLVATARTGPRSAGPGRLERWRRVVLEACKQCGRRRVPEVTLLAEVPREVPPGVLGLLLDPGDGAAPLRRELASEPPRRAWLAVGPEGGFGPREIEERVRSGWRRCALGPRVLRTETAGVVAAALVLHTWGDLG